MFIIFKNMNSLAQLYIYLIQKMICSITDEGKQNKILSRQNVLAPASDIVKSYTPGLKATDKINNLGIIHKHMNEDQKIRFHHNDFMVDINKVSESENHSSQKKETDYFINASNDRNSDTKTEQINFDKEDPNDMINLHGSNPNLSMRNNKDTKNPVIENLQGMSKNANFNLESTDSNIDNSTHTNLKFLSKSNIFTSIYRDEMIKHDTKVCLIKAINHLEFANKIDYNVLFEKPISEFLFSSINEARQVLLLYFSDILTSLDNNCFKFLNETKSVKDTLNTLQTRVKNYTNNSEILDWFDKIEKELSCLITNIKNDEGIIFLTTSMKINEFFHFIINKFSPKNNEDLSENEHEHKRGNEMPIDLLEIAILDQNITYLDFER